MQEPTTKTSAAFTLRTYIAQRTWLRRTVRVLGWLAALLVLLLVIISLVLHVWLLPQIDRFRPKIEAFASESLGVAVSIGRITTTEQGWQSALELRQVRLRNAQGHDDLTIEAVQVAASPWRLLQGGVNRLALIQPKLHVRRMRDHTIYVAGVLAHDPKKESPKTQKTNAGLNWLLKQNMVRIQHGSITWHDATRTVQPVTATGLNARLNNHHFVHVLQAQVQAPAGWGKSIHLQGRWRHGITQAAGNWQAWTGTAQLAIDRFNAQPWQSYIDLGAAVAIRKASGKLVLKTQWHSQKQRDFTLEATLDDVDAQLGKNVPPLALNQLAAQLHLNIHQSSQDRTMYRLSSKQLRLTTPNNAVWENGQFSASVHTNAAHEVLAGSAQADNINLALVRDIGRSLPLSKTLQDALRQYQPQGVLQQVQLNWQGALKALTSYSLRATGKDMAWLAQPSGKTNAKGRPVVGIPGVKGVGFDINMNHTGGTLQLTVDKGHIEAPGVFKHPRLQFDTLNSHVRWHIRNGHIQAQLNTLTFANSDAQGEVQATWNTHPNTSGAKRFPGVLDVTGTIQRAKAEKVVRYLPLSIGDDALRYVGASIRSGTVRNARVRISGNVADIPFNKSPTGTFQFQVPLRNTEFAFMPRYLQKSHEKSWPSLVQLNGQLEIDKISLTLSKVSTRFSSAPDVRIRNLAAHIPNMGKDLVVGVTAHVDGPLQQIFDVTRTSPLSNIINKSLDTATATGDTTMQLTLGLPITRIQESMVRGTVQLNHNDVRITPETPLMADSTGKIQFDERGFHFKKIHTQLLGGKATLQGGTVHKGKATAVQFKAQGTLTGKGLRDEPTVNTVAALGKFMHGTSPYTAELNYRAGAPELKLKTSLVGMELKLPYPLGKTAAEALPFDFDNTIYKTARVRGKAQAVQDQVRIRMGNIVQAQYIRSLRPNTSAHVMQGSIAVGNEAVEQPPELPETGVEALILLEKFNADAWISVLETGWGRNQTVLKKTKPDTNAKATENTEQVSTPATNAPTNKATATHDAAAPILAPTPVPVTQETIASRYLPNLVDMQTTQLILNNLDFNELVVSGSREGRLWKLSLSAKEVLGHIEYLQALRDGPGAIKARLARLIINPAEVQQVTTYVRQTVDPKALPMLDVQAQNVDVTGYKFSQLNILASNSSKRNLAGADLIDETFDPNIPNTWHLHSLYAATAHGNLQGSGVWGINGSNAAQKIGIESLLSRHVDLQVRMVSKNVGAVLDHFGYKQFAKGGSGLVSGTLRWNGSPVSPDWSSLSGDVRVDVRQGSITRINPGAAKFLGLLSLQGLTKLGKIAEKGFAYDRIQGRLIAKAGSVHSNNLAITGSLANVKISGQAHLIQQTMQLDVVVLPKIDLSAAALLTSAINPIVGVGSYLAQWIISKPLSRMARQVLSITGSWEDPKVQKLKGKQATTVAKRVLSTHELPTAFHRLWDWSPISKKPAQTPSATPAAP